MAKPVVRLTVNVDPEVAARLRWLAETWDTTQTEALHRAILATALLQEKAGDEGRVMVRGSGDKVEELTLSPAVGR